MTPSVFRVESLCNGFLSSSKTNIWGPMWMAYLFQFVSDIILAFVTLTLAARLQSYLEFFVHLQKTTE